MSMSRKDFEALAGAVRAANTLGDARTIRLVADALADVCARANPQFDYARFMRACGTDSSKPRS